MLSETDADVVVLAGDIGLGTQGIEYARTLKKSVVIIPGNHEFYHREMASTLNDLANAASGDVHLLLDSETVIGGVRFVGGPLWTDFMLCGVYERWYAEQAALRGISDFQVIGNGHRKLLPEDVKLMHEHCKERIRKVLDTPFNGKTVVVTHFLPHPRSIAHKYRYREMERFNAYYCSKLDLSGADLWLHGHTHESCDYVEGTTRVVCNPRGYRHQVNPNYNPALVLQI